MERAHRRVIAGLTLICTLSGGCATRTSLPPTSAPVSTTSRVVPAVPDRDTQSLPLRQVAAVTQPNDDALPARPAKTAPAFPGVPVLAVEGVIEKVLDQNPSLAQMTAAWEAAAARYPQVVSLDDPLVGATVGPASIGAREVDFAYRLEASQKLPFPGKRALRGQVALAEAEAAGGEADDMRLQLIEAARTAFFDYYLAHRAQEVNEESLRLLGTYRQTALDRIKANQATQQDVLQTEVEMGRQRERGLALERLRRVAVARINTLMHLAPDAPLPPPPKLVQVTGELPDVAQLRHEAVARRPDLRALARQIAAEEANLKLALREYCPDFEVTAAYDAFWQTPERDLRPQLGLRLNLPVRKERRAAAVAEAQARIAQRRAQLERQTDAALYEIQQAFEQARESLLSYRLYDKDILPTARRNVEAAQTALASNRIPFLSLIEAQRSYVNLLERSHEVSADYFRRRAALDRAIGLFPTGDSTPTAVNMLPPRAYPPASNGGTSLP